MDTIRKSLMDKISQKGVITPYEAIHLQCLDWQHKRAQTPNVQVEPNPYIAVENIASLIQPYQLKELLTFQNARDGDVYDGYRWAATEMIHLDSGIGDIAYKGVALLSELRYMRDECVTRLFLNMRDGKPTTSTLFDFSAYSQVNQKQMTFREVFEAFFEEFRHFFILIDNILTLNYYLNEMAALEEFRFPTYVKMWLAQNGDEFVVPINEGKEEEGLSFNVTRLCCNVARDIIISNNHPDYVELMSNKLSEYSLTLPKGFAENSLMYVEGIVSEIVGEKVNYLKEI